MAGLPTAEDNFRESLLNTLIFDFNATTAHMEAARHFSDQLDTFKRNARTVIQEMSSLGAMLDPLLLELFQTEFHIKFLWGERGSQTTAAQRFKRLTDILTSMAQKIINQPPSVMIAEEV